LASRTTRMETLRVYDLETDLIRSTHYLLSLSLRRVLFRKNIGALDCSPSKRVNTSLGTRLDIVSRLPGTCVNNENTRMPTIR
jgi:hypothetical protein